MFNCFTASVCVCVGAWVCVHARQQLDVITHVCVCSARLPFWPFVSVCGAKGCFPLHCWAHQKFNVLHTKLSPCQNAQTAHHSMLWKASAVSFLTRLTQEKRWPSLSIWLENKSFKLALYQAAVRKIGRCGSTEMFTFLTTRFMTSEKNITFSCKHANFYGQYRRSVDVIDNTTRHLCVLTKYNYVRLICSTNLHKKHQIFTLWKKSRGQHIQDVFKGVIKRFHNCTYLLVQ